jgi:hypothetical protein
MNTMQKLLTVYLFLFVVCVSSFQVPLRGKGNDAGGYVYEHLTTIILTLAHSKFD